jgi:hypothetical protein
MEPSYLNSSMKVDTPLPDNVTEKGKRRKALLTVTYAVFKNKYL